MVLLATESCMWGMCGVCVGGRGLGEYLFPSPLGLEMPRFKTGLPNSWASTRPPRRRLHNDSAHKFKLSVFRLALVGPVIQEVCVLAPICYYPPSPSHVYSLWSAGPTHPERGASTCGEHPLLGNRRAGVLDTVRPITP